MQDETPPLNRLLGLDIGTKRTGVAISDWSGVLATPYVVLASTDRKQLFNELAQIIKDEEIQGIVVGIPLDADGEVGRDALKMRHHIAALRARFPIPVLEWDERYTTVEAERVLLAADVSREKRRSVIDKIAAGILLQSFLDSRTTRRSSQTEE